MYDQNISLNLLPIIILSVMISAIVILCKELSKFIRKQISSKKKSKFKGFT